MRRPFLREGCACPAPERTSAIRTTPVGRLTPEDEEGSRRNERLIPRTEKGFTISCAEAHDPSNVPSSAVLIAFATPRVSLCSPHSRDSVLHVPSIPELLPLSNNVPSWLRRPSACGSAKFDEWNRPSFEPWYSFVGKVYNGLLSLFSM